MSTPFQGMFPDFRKLQEQLSTLFTGNGMPNIPGMGPGFGTGQGPGNSSGQSGWPFSGGNGNWTEWMQQMGIPFTGTSFGTAQSSSGMPVDIYESGDTLLVVAEIPGLTDAREVELSVYPDRLVIKGQTGRNYAQGSGTIHVSERNIGAFERSVNLPVPVKRSSARARYRNGLLYVSLQISKSAAATDASSVSIDFK